MDGYEYDQLKSGLMEDPYLQSSGRYDTQNQQGDNQTFKTEFPMPQPPTINFSSSMYDSSESLFNQYGYKSSFQKEQGYITTKSGLTFRSADSTERAIRDLEIKKRESRTKRRASAMVAFLFVLAIIMLSVTKNQDEILMEATSGIDANMVVAGQLESNDSELKREDTEEPPPVEEIIEEGKEFLQPFRYFSDTASSRRETDSNFFFHIPRSGGQTIKNIAGKCLGKTLTSEMGVREGHDTDVALQEVEIDETRYVNVDTASIDGLHRAANLGLAASNLADLITSSYFGEVGMLFELEHKGRAFTVLRDPLERAVSHYHHATRGDNAFIDPSVTLEDYAQGNGIENNWVCRFLTGQMEGEITKEHLEQAKDILKRKFLVGFLDDGEETVYRIMKYFDWTFDSDEEKRIEQEECIVRLIKEKTNINEVEYEIPERGSQANALIKWQTQFDGKLYDYARQLFEEQTKEFGSKTRKKMLRKKKKLEKEKAKTVNKGKK